MKLYKKILLALLFLFIAIQFIRPAHNTSGQLLPTDITKSVNVPDKVLGIFKNACYDCHSNNTRYPWYVNIQPMGWIMARHVKNGKKDFNFSEFGTYSNRKQANKLRAIETSIKDGSMPISSYTIMHTDAKLTSNDTATINYWVRKIKDSLAIKN
ncbi:MAG: heme-binding domain-containing protein [Ferruginibacter sp.]